MYDFLISQEQARQFAYDCFDVILRDIKAMEDQKNEVPDTEEESRKSA